MIVDIEVEAEGEGTIGLGGYRISKAERVGKVMRWQRQGEYEVAKE